MERHTPWFQLMAVVLVVVGLFTLAAPAPVHAMDPQLMMAMASAAGAIALIVGYLIVANGRERQRAASLEGIYTCSDREASGPMGCGGPGSGKPAPAAYAPSATPESPMATEGGSAPRATALAGLDSCPRGQASGPMGCGGPMDSGTGYSAGSGSGFSSGAPAPAALPSAVQGQ
jgi:hypothetical protein